MQQMGCSEITKAKTGVFGEMNKGYESRSESGNYIMRGYPPRATIGYDGSLVMFGVFSLLTIIFLYTKSH